MVLSSIIAFAVSLLVGAAAIYAGGAVVTGTKDYSHAIITALVGAVVWLLTSLFLGWIPLLGPLMVLAAYLWVINSRYPGGWIDAGLIALVAWVAGFAIITVLTVVGLADAGALGVPAL